MKTNWIFYAVPQQIIRLGRPILTHDAIAQVAARLGVSKNVVSGYISSLVRVGQLGIANPHTANSTLL